MRWLVIALLALPNLAIAQNHFCSKQIITASGGGVEYPFTSSGVFATSGAKMYIDFTQDPSSSPITDNTGNYDFVVGGTPTRTYDGTWPNGLGGTEGRQWVRLTSSDELSRAADGALDATTLFTSVGVTLTLSIASSPDYLVNKVSGTTGYRLYSLADDVYLRTYNGTSPILSATNVLAVGRISCVVATLDGTGGVGGSTGYLYVDEYTASTSSTLNNVAASIKEYEIVSFRESNVNYVGYYDNTVWTESQARAFCRNFYGVTSNDGNYLSTTSAAPAATFLTDSGNPSYLVSTSPDTSIVGRWGYYAHPAIDNLVQRSSFESWPTWDETTTAGDGSSAIAQVSTATAAHGLSHISMTLTGTTSAAEVRSACITSGISSDLYVQAQAKKGSGTTQAAVKIHEYSDASCTTSIGTTDIVAATDLTTSWAEYGGQFSAASWNGSTAGYEIELHETCNGGCDSHWDAIQAASRSVPTSSYCVTCDTDATCSCTGAQSTIPQPLSVGGWKVSLTMRSDYSSTFRTGGLTGSMIGVPATAGSNNKVHLFWSGGAVFFDINDSGGTLRRAQKSITGSADTDYLIEAYHYANGDIKVCVDSSCSSTTANANLDGINSTFYLGSDPGGTPRDMWIRNLKVEPL